MHFQDDRAAKKSQKDKTPREHRNVAHQITCPQLNVLLAEWNVPGIWRVQVDPTPLILARMLVASELLYQELKIPVQNRSGCWSGAQVERRL